MNKHTSVNPSFRQEVENAFEIIKLNKEALEKVSSDSGLTKISFLMFIISAFATTLGFCIIQSSDILPMNLRISFDIFYFLNVFTVNILLEFISILTIALSAKYIFQGKEGIFNFLRPMMYASLIKVVNLIPLLGLFSGIWYFYLQYKIIKKVYELEIPGVILSMLLGIVAVASISMVMNSLGLNIFKNIGLPQ